MAIEGFFDILFRMLSLDLYLPFDYALIYPYPILSFIPYPIKIVFLELEWQNLRVLSQIILFASNF